MFTGFRAGSERRGNTDSHNEKVVGIELFLKRELLNIPLPFNKNFKLSALARLTLEDRYAVGSS